MRKFLFLFLFVVFGLALSVLQITGSYLLSLSSVGAFFLVWFIVANLKSIHGGKEFRSFIERYSVDHPFPESGVYAEGYMFLGNKTNVVGVFADDVGIYLFSASVFECLIEWKKIEHIKVNILENNKYSAELKFLYQSRILVIPWRKEFEVKSVAEDLN